MRFYTSSLAAFSLATVLATACGTTKKDDDKNKEEQTTHNAEEREQTVGMYRSDSKALSDAGSTFFVITNDHDVCAIRNDKTRPYRDCRGNLGDARYFFNGKTFKSGDATGQKIDESEVPAEHKLLFNLIAVAKDMNADLNKEKLAVSIYLAGSHMEFKPKQLELLRALKSETAALKDFLKANSATTLKVSDYTNQIFYIKDQAFGIASGTDFDVQKTVDAIKAKTLKFARY